MSNRQSRILQELQSGAASIHTLARNIDAPTASIRRDIQAIRRAGYSITDARDTRGVYRLTNA